MTKLDHSRKGIAKKFTRKIYDEIMQKEDDTKDMVFETCDNKTDNSERGFTGEYAENQEIHDEEYDESCRIQAKSFVFVNQDEENETATTEELG